MDAQLTVRLPQPLQRRLSQYANKLRLKRSDVIRLALEEFLSNAEEEQERPFVRVRSLIGEMESGIPDLGAEHRKHLVARFRRG
ncbi:ribbon-helix-helix protein, CopG family [bacterium]|nr:ribbon-helix-helix protein, CopG family [bacterium]MCI0605744.1 ribbon-helix-helix protein, CopG family [bacterium]